ncbi:MAG: hypothetical protein M8840_08600 [marine benthic group bacterium]|mgnify:FL=1|nr:hypothetical protein [Gemmatimonadota bacterium]MCL7991187.1 hypothetical protein [Gemmatimonadota bacterium]
MRMGVVVETAAASRDPWRGEAMDERRYWMTDPDGLLAGAAQAVQAKHAIARHLGCSWDDVDRALADALIETLRQMPSRGRLRRREDRSLLSCVGRLVPEIPPDDPLRAEIRRRLRAKLEGV